MRHLRPALKNRIVLHALVKQLFARGKNPLVGAAVAVAVFVHFVGFAAGRQLVEAHAAGGARGGVGVLVNGGLRAGVLGGTLAGDCWGGGGGDGLAGAVGKGAGCLGRAGGGREGEVVGVDCG